MTKTLTVEGDITAVDTLTNITTQGSVTAPSRVVPSGVTKIDKIYANICADGLAAGSAVYFIRLGGGAVLNGEQTLMISAQGLDTVQSGSDQYMSVAMARVFDDLDIPVRAQDVINISAEMAGSDMGTAYAVVTLVFA